MNKITHLAVGATEHFSESVSDFEGASSVWIEKRLVNVRFAY